MWVSARSSRRAGFADFACTWSFGSVCSHCFGRAASWCLRALGGVSGRRFGVAGSSRSQRSGNRFPFALVHSAAVASAAARLRHGVASAAMWSDAVNWRLRPAVWTPGASALGSLLGDRVVDRVPERHNDSRVQGFGTAPTASAASAAEVGTRHPRVAGWPGLLGQGVGFFRAMRRFRLWSGLRLCPRSGSGHRFGGGQGGCTAATHHACHGLGRGRQCSQALAGGDGGSLERTLRRARDRGHGTSGNRKRAKAAVMRYGCRRGVFVEGYDLRCGDASRCDQALDSSSVGFTGGGNAVNPMTGTRLQ